MKLKKFLLILMSFLFLGTIPAFADGGIPLWIWTAQDILGGSIGISLTEIFNQDVTFKGILAIISAIFVICLISLQLIAIVVFIETIVFRIILGKLNNGGKIIKTVLFSNLTSTILGTILFAIVYIVSYHSEQALLINAYGGDHLTTVLFGVHGAILGGLGLLLHNIFYFIISYYSEYMISLKLLKDEFENIKIKKAVIWSNLVTYAIPIIISFIFVLIFIFGGGFDEINKFSIYTNEFLMYCFGTVILPAILVLILVMCIKICLSKQEEVKK